MSEPPPAREPRATGGWPGLGWLAAQLGMPVSGLSLAVFRMGYGLVMAYEAWHLLASPSFEDNLLSRIYSGPGVRWTFPYPGLEWIRPSAPPAMNVVAGVQLAAAVALTAGLAARLSAAVVAVAWSYIFLCEAAYYLNHFYLQCLFGLLLVTMPSSAAWSVDAWLARRRATPQGGRESWIPAWPVWLLRGQMAIVYFYAGIAKLNPDWLAGQPVRLWLNEGIFGGGLSGALGPGWQPLLEAVLVNEATIGLICYGGMIFDLCVPLLLLVPRTRLLGLVLAACFHGSNALLFNVGSFPALGMVATTIFLPPDWPARLRDVLGRGRIPEPDWPWLVAGALAVPLLGAALAWRLADESGPGDAEQAASAGPRSATRAPRAGWPAAVWVVGWLALQLLIPLRHLVIAGPATWTDEGSRFAWLMMLRDKRPGHLSFRVIDPAAAAEGVASPAGESWVDRRAKYRQVDSRHVDWTALPELVVVHEPFLGERLFYNPHAPGAAREAASIRRRLAAVWQARYGREPQLVATVPLVQCLESLSAQVLPGGDREGSLRAGDPRGLLVRALELAAAIEEPGRDGTSIDRLVAQLQNCLDALVLDRRLGNTVLAGLTRAAPLGLLGATGDDGPWLSVHDPQLAERSAFAQWRLRPAAWEGEPVVVLDLNRTGPLHLQDLPPRFVLHEPSGRTSIVWNHVDELTPLQISPLGMFPYLQHAYARHIADEWQRATGRRPAVHVESFAALNDRPLQRMIDPETDLARVPLWWWRHNPWILPLNEPPAR